MKQCLILACLFAGFALPMDAQQLVQPAPARPHIVVTGQGEQRVKPERVYAEIAVESTAPTAVAAAAENARLMSAVRAALQRAGVPQQAISGAGYSVRARPASVQGIPQPEGYIAANVLRLETQQFDRLGAMIDAALAAGANRVQAVRYAAGNSEDARRQALTAAIERARADAEIMARAAGGRLGPLLELSTSRFDAAPGVSYVYDVSIRGSSEATAITPQELILRANVLARWAFLQQ
jgi:uncharacterized protein YggE